MSELFILRRANGDLFKEQVEGSLRIPLWTSAEAVARYKERNPELMVFLPARLDRSLVKRIRSGSGPEGVSEFFLLSEDEPDADLYDGRPVKLEDIFPDDQITSQPERLQV